MANLQAIHSVGNSLVTYLDNSYQELSETDQSPPSCKFQLPLEPGDRYSLGSWHHLLTFSREHTSRYHWTDILKLITFNPDHPSDVGNAETV